MPEFYRHGVQDSDSNDTGETDRAKLLEQQTLQMQTEWQQQQAAAHACKSRESPQTLMLAQLCTSSL